MSLPSINFLHLTVSEIQPGKISNIKVTTAGQWSNQGHSMVVRTFTNVYTMYQLPTPYGFGDIAQSKFLNPRSLQ